MAAPPQKFQHHLVAELAALSLRLEAAYEVDVAGLRKEMEESRQAEEAEKQAKMEQCRGVEALQEEVLQLKRQVEVLERGKQWLQERILQEAAVPWICQTCHVDCASAPVSWAHAILRRAFDAQTSARRAEGIADYAAALKRSTTEQSSGDLKAALTIARQVSPAPRQAWRNFEDRGDSADGALTPRPSLERDPAEACPLEPQVRSRGEPADHAASPQTPLEEPGWATGDEGNGSEDPEDLIGDSGNSVVSEVSADSESSQVSDDSEHFNERDAVRKLVPAERPTAGADGGLPAVTAPKPVPGERPVAGADGVLAAAAAPTPAPAECPAAVADGGLAAAAAPKPAPAEPPAAGADGGPRSARPLLQAPAGGADWAGEASSTRAEVEDRPSEGSPEGAAGTALRAPAPKPADGPAGGSAADDLAAGSGGPPLGSRGAASEEEEQGWEESGEPAAKPARRASAAAPESSGRASTAVPGPSERQLAAAPAAKPVQQEEGQVTSGLPPHSVPAWGSTRSLCKFRVVLVCGEDSRCVMELMRLLTCHSEISAVSGRDFFEGVGSILLSGRMGSAPVDISNLEAAACRDEARLQLQMNKSDPGRKLWSWLDDQKGSPRLNNARARRTHQHEKRFIQHLADGMAPLKATAMFTDRILTESLTYGKNVALFEMPLRRDALSMLEQIYPSTRLIHILRPGQHEDGEHAGLRGSSGAEEARPPNPRCGFEWGRLHPDRYLEVECLDCGLPACRALLCRILAFLGAVDQVDMMLRKRGRLGSG